MGELYVHVYSYGMNMMKCTEQKLYEYQFWNVICTLSRLITLQLCLQGPQQTISWCQ